MDLKFIKKIEDTKKPTVTLACVDQKEVQRNFSQEFKIFSKEPRHSTKKNPNTKHREEQALDA